MFVSYVIRLRPEQLHRGLFAGEIEAVASGHCEHVDSAAQMEEFMLRTMTSEMATAIEARLEQECG
jgi:hypothetical protein